MISVSEAIQRLSSSFSSVGIEEVPLIQAAGRVLSKKIRSDINLPLFTNSSMDGFAVRAEDIQGARQDQPVILNVVEDIPAGHRTSKIIGNDQAARIMTGAPLPEGANAVVPIEDTDQYDSVSRSQPHLLPTEIEVYRSVSEGAYVRLVGEDVTSGEDVLNPKSRLRPQDLGLLAMLGISQVSVYRRPRIIILSTGDELLPVDVPLQPGKIHDSNAYTLSALISRDGGLPEYLGIVPDQEKAVRGSLETAVKHNADLILSSAGVSVGAFDFVRSIIQSDGELEFWRVNIRPGKPVAFGNFQGVPFIGLPGNPVSAFVGYEVFGRPAILRLSGITNPIRSRIRTKIREDIESDGRESYLRAVVHSHNGEWIARLTGHQGSGNLLSLVQANALLIIPSGVKSLPSGTEVEAWLLDP
ncbi:gephyrin-like molybdotransferase Glp [Chloroflexota bacterium]